ncbi:outer membrane protein assembly factor BamD [Phenylobacterium sp.]|uniref:outer membrane protein assembly factor BamD n=1 Tax=Phenylobacterium sp. TaxID=1871053 RepID=UPI002730867D|nr:outer membrane protein assembly factor BamD [Phenylobacterium sp.]MDP1618790.1 outer membrane protein assembly factor BamD [Phenylobacterium sp.]MDP1989291.1 outer membrane protein assembly factor BamD [Phenylobacterium sp.]
MLHNSLRGPAVATVLATLVLGACAGREDRPQLAYEERPVELLYNTGANRLDRGLWNQAVDYFAEVERQHPYSVWARRSILMTAYAQYQANDYAEAISSADRFLSQAPGNPAAVYAYYLKAICYFEQIVDVGRDQAATGQALNALQEVVQRYPDSEYAKDARLKIDMVRDQLAGKEMTVGRYYLRNNDTLAGIGRFNTVVERYETTSHTPEALYRLVEAYLTLGLNEEAKRNGAVLGFNYPGSVWYRDAYNLLTSRGLRPANAPASSEQRSLWSRLPFVGGGSDSEDLERDKDATLRPPESQ